MKPHDHWTVLPHGRIKRLSSNLFTVVGQLPMPLGTTPRRMTLVRLADRKLIIYSAIALGESSMREIEAIGRPTYLVVPSDIHRLDVKAWKQRYPWLTVIAPEGAREKVEEVVPVDATSMSFEDPSVLLNVVPGTDNHEFALTVATPTGKTLVLNDLVFNLHPMKGVRGFFMRLIPKIVQAKVMKDRAAIRQQFFAWSKMVGLERILPSHGAMITEPRGKLLELAQAI